MQSKWVRGCYFRGYGPSLMLGVGVPIPILNEQIAVSCAVQDGDILAPVVDFLHSPSGSSDLWPGQLRPS